MIIYFNASVTQREFKSIKREDMKLSNKTKTSGDILGCVAESDSDGRNF